ncbi:hypothetical protein TNCV_3812581 [Trichonephila clavipes]|nr:hypothetical protein TNCV_3812581 [Trichonephila clavipes]
MKVSRQNFCTTCHSSFLVVVGVFQTVWRAVIRLLFAESMKPEEIIRRMQAHYGYSCSSQSKICKWIERFKQIRSSLCDNEKSDSASISTTEGPRRRDGDLRPIN